MAGISLLKYSTSLARAVQTTIRGLARKGGTFLGTLADNDPKGRGGDEFAHLSFS